MHCLKVVSHFPSLLCPQSNVGIVDLLWLNKHQYCGGGGEGEEDRKSILNFVGKSAKFLKTLDQDCRWICPLFGRTVFSSNLELSCEDTLQSRNYRSVLCYQAYA